MSNVQNIAHALQQRFGEEVAVDPGLNGLDELARIAGHRVHRRYDGRPVDPALLRLLCACTLSAPSKSDLQQRDIVIVEDRAVLRAARIGQEFVVEVNPEIQAWLADLLALHSHG